MRLQFGQMFLRPATERAKRLDQSSAESRKRIFNSWRHNRINFALHQAVSFQTAQRLSQHLLRDAADLAVQLGVTHRFFREQLDYNRSPFVCDAIEDEAGRTLRVEDGGGG